MLENLLSFTSYQLVIRTTNTSKPFLQTETLYFSTSGKKNQVNILIGHCMWQRSLLRRT